MKYLEVLFTPAEFSVLPGRDLARTTCVVFDVLRATTTIVTAFAHGAAAVIPVSEISAALALKKRYPEALLAGERNGLKITAQVSGGPDFDFGNSPREFIGGRARGKILITTTTNGTRALRACLGAKSVLLGSFLNLGATAARLRRVPSEHVLLVCSGTHEEAALEDALGAGALCQALTSEFSLAERSDSAEMARQLFIAAKTGLADALARTRNGGRLWEIPDLREDVAFAAQVDRFKIVPSMNRDGIITTGSE